MNCWTWRKILHLAEGNICVWRPNKSYIARIPVNSCFVLTVVSDTSIIAEGNALTLCYFHSVEIVLMLGRQRAVSIAFVWLVKLTIVLLDFLSVLLHVHRHFLQWYNKEKYPTDPIKIQRLRYYTFYFVFVRNIRTLGIIYGYITKVELVDCYLYTRNSTISTDSDNCIFSPYGQT